MLDVEIVGDYAYLAAEAQGLRVLDIRDRNKPTEVGALTDAPVFNVTVSGSYAYVAGAAPLHGLGIVDISEPTQPKQVGSVPIRTLFPNTSDPVIADIAVAGMYAYATSGQFGLVVVDIADPRAPKVAQGIFTGLPDTSPPGAGGQFTYTRAVGQALVVSYGLFTGRVSYAGGLVVFPVGVPCPADARYVLSEGTAGGALAVAGSYVYQAHDYLSVYEASGVAPTPAPTPAGVRPFRLYGPAVFNAAPCPE